MILRMVGDVVLTQPDFKTMLQPCLTKAVTCLSANGTKIKIICLFGMLVPYPVRAQNRHHDKARKPVVYDLLLPNMSMGHVNEYLTMHYFGNLRHTQSMLA